MTTSLACPDWWERLQRGDAPMPDLVLDETRADVAVGLFDKLRVPDIPGQPTMGEAAGDWIRAIVRVAFGSVDPATGARVVSELFNLIPKKNGKTTNAAALGLVALQMNMTPNIDGVIVGPTQEVAQKCFDQAAAMIAIDPWLSKRFDVKHHQKTIIDRYADPKTGRPLNAKLKIKSFDPAILTGSVPAFAIFDELHVMAEKHYADRVLGQVRGGMITNPDALLVFITTQSEREPQGIFKRELDYARKVRDGAITKNVRMLPVLYEFPADIQESDDEPWRDPRLWPMVLPNLDRSFNLDTLRRLYDRAVEDGPEELARWASQHLNIQIGRALRGDWVGARFWEKNAEPGLTLETLLATSDVVVIGGDAGGADDLFALAVIGRHKETRVWQVWVRAWCLDLVLDRRKELAPRFRDFARDGDLVITETAEEHIHGAADVCEQVLASGLLPPAAAIGVDAWGIAALVDELLARGFAQDQIAAVGQGYKLNGAIKGAERRLFDGKIKHGGQPLMGWSMSNARAEQRGNNVLITKAQAGIAKIDPIMAMFNAAMLMDRNPEVRPRTPWDEDPEYRMSA